MFENESVGFDEAAAEGGSAAGYLDAVNHAVAVDHMVRAARGELRVRAVLEVSAVQARREGALYHLAGGGGELVHRGEAAGEDVFRV